MDDFYITTGAKTITFFGHFKRRVCLAGLCQVDGDIVQVATEVVVTLPSMAEFLVVLHKPPGGLGTFGRVENQVVIAAQGCVQNITRVSPSLIYM